MRAPSIAFAVCAGIMALATGGSAQTTPEGLLRGGTATSGTTDVGGGAFQEGERPPDELKNTTELTLSAGGLYWAGNTNSEALTSATQFKIRRGHNQGFAAAAANVARAALGDDGLETTVENFQGKVRYDRFLTGNLAAFLGSTGRRDRFQGLALRLNVDPGLAYYYIDDEKHQLWTELGYDVQYDIRTAQAIESAAAADPPVPLADAVTRHSVRAFAGYENKINDKVAVTTGLEYIQSVEDSQFWRLNWDWQLTSTLVGRLAAATTFSLRYDHAPLPGIARTDVITSVSLVLTIF
jgi:putative salt-induced outer membrane protein